MGLRMTFNLKQAVFLIAVGVAVQLIADHIKNEYYRPWMIYYKC